MTELTNVKIEKYQNSCLSKVTPGRESVPTKQLLLTAPALYPTPRTAAECKRKHRPLTLTPWSQGREPPGTFHSLNHRDQALNSISLGATSRSVIRGEAGVGRMSQWVVSHPPGGKTGWEWERPQGHSGLVQGRPKPFSLPDLTHTWCWSASRWRPGWPDKPGCPAPSNQGLLDSALPGVRDF